MNINWLWASIPIALIFLSVIAILVIKLIQTQRTSALASLPLVAEQTLILETTGTMLLHVEWPLLNGAFGDLKYQIINRVNNQVLPFKLASGKLLISGIKKSRLFVGRFEVESVGEYQLQIKGINAEAITNQHKIVITLDNRVRVVSIILGLIFSGLFLVASIGLNAMIFMQVGVT